MLKVLDPMGDLAQAPEGLPLKAIDGLENRRIGFIWGQHAASVKFWPVYEDVAQEKLNPSEVQRYYKPSTWNPAADEEVQRIAKEIDIALIGVGA